MRTAAKHSLYHRRADDLQPVKREILSTINGIRNANPEAAKYLEATAGHVLAVYYGRVLAQPLFAAF